jgi:hypothetical protein
VADARRFPENQAAQADGIRGLEERAEIIKAADAFEKHDGRELADTVKHARKANSWDKSADITENKWIFNRRSW